MRRLLPLLGLTFALAGVAAAPALSASAPVRPNAAVGSDGSLTTAAAAELADPNTFMPVYQGTAFYLNAADTLDGTPRPAGWNLTRAELNWLQANYPSTWGGALTTIRPDNATYTSSQAAVNSQLNRTRRRGGWLPSMKDRYGGAAANARLALKVGVWSVASSIGLSGYTQAFDLLTGSSDIGNTVPEASTTGFEFDCSQTYCSTKTYGWKFYEEGDIMRAVADDGDGLGSGLEPLAPETGWYSQVYMHSSNITATVPSPVTVQTAREYDADDITDFGTQHHAGDAWVLKTPAASWVTIPDPSSGTTWWSRYMTEGEFEEEFDSEPLTENEFNTYGGDKVTNNTYVQAPDRAAGAASLGTPGAGQTTVQGDTEIAIAIKVAPGADPTTGVSPAPTGAADDPITIAPPATTVPGAPALDFTPISDIDFGCKFPYGIFCYALAFTDLFDVTPDAPCFCFELDGFDTPAGTMSLGSYDVDLEVMDGWMNTWRSILSVVLWVGAIYFVATRLLGFKAGGDPGAAMDDVL